MTFSNIYHYKPYEIGWIAKVTNLQYSGGPKLIQPRSDIAIFRRSPRGDFFQGAQTPPPVTFQME